MKSRCPRLRMSPLRVRGMEKSMRGMAACAASVFVLVSCAGAERVDRETSSSAPPTSADPVLQRAEQLSRWSIVAYSCEALGYRVIKSKSEIEDILFEEIGTGEEGNSADIAARIEEVAVRQRADFASSAMAFSIEGPNAGDRGARSAAYRRFLQSISKDCSAAARDVFFSRILQPHQ